MVPTQSNHFALRKLIWLTSFPICQKLGVCLVPLLALIGLLSPLPLGRLVVQSLLILLSLGMLFVVLLSLRLVEVFEFPLGIFSLFLPLSESLLTSRWLLVLLGISLSRLPFLLLLLLVGGVQRFIHLVALRRT